MRPWNMWTVGTQYVPTVQTVGTQYVPTVQTLGTQSVPIVRTVGTQYVPTVWTVGTECVPTVWTVGTYRSIITTCNNREFCFKMLTKETKLFQIEVFIVDLYVPTVHTVGTHSVPTVQTVGTYWVPTVPSFQGLIAPFRLKIPFKHYNSFILTFIIVLFHQYIEHQYMWGWVRKRGGGLIL